MAAAALRSAADDLGKSGTSRVFNLSLTSRITAETLVGRDPITEVYDDNHPIDLRQLSFLILEIAQTLDRTADLV
jgi:hypothetical protein